MSNLNFLKEMKEKFSIGFEKHDPTMIEYGFKMINDWISELENAKEQGVEGDGDKYCRFCGTQDKAHHYQGCPKRTTPAL